MQNNATNGTHTLEPQQRFPVFPLLGLCMYEQLVRAPLVVLLHLPHRLRRARASESCIRRVLDDHARLILACRFDARINIYILADMLA